ncbi:Uncharacterised protein [Bordetella pertussis]|nr:Uncharacterised protein [Bordetella pertussis]
MPHMSSRSCGLGVTTGVANSRITCAAAVISPTVSFLTRSPISSALAICGDSSPRISRRIRCSISSWKISRCSMQRVSASVAAMVMAMLLGVQRVRKLRISAWPCSLSTDSGWNCTPYSGRVLWRTPMMSPSGAVAVTSRQSGRVAGSMVSEL